MPMGFESFAALKMAFEARRDLLARFMKVPEPPKELAAEGPRVRAVYRRGYEVAFWRALHVDEADDAGLVSTLAEYDDYPFLGAWLRGVADGDASGRLHRDLILRGLARDAGADHPDQTPE